MANLHTHLIRTMHHLTPINNHIPIIARHTHNHRQLIHPTPQLRRQRPQGTILISSHQPT
jgi:hypothetical protein